MDIHLAAFTQMKAPSTTTTRIPCGPMQEIYFMAPLLRTLNWSTSGPSCIVMVTKKRGDVVEVALDLYHMYSALTVDVPSLLGIDPAIATQWWAHVVMLRRDVFVKSCSSIAGQLHTYKFDGVCKMHCQLVRHRCCGSNLHKGIGILSRRMLLSSSAMLVLWHIRRYLVSLVSFVTT